jgi:hypothetical protein
LTFTNLINMSLPPTGDLSFACGLAPGFFRDMLLGCGGKLGFDNVYQLSGAFNVATGYAGLYLSWGALGVALFSAIHGVISAHAFACKECGVGGKLFYVITMQITVLMVFGNGFFNLNVLGQYFLLYLFSFKIVFRN